MARCLFSFARTGKLVTSPSERLPDLAPNLPCGERSAGTRRGGGDQDDGGRFLFSPLRERRHAQATSSV